MSDFISAKHDGQPCLLNMDYVMDIFPEGNNYKAYTKDFDRGEYLIRGVDFDNWWLRQKVRISDDL